MVRLKSKQLIEGIEPFSGAFDAGKPYLWIWNPLEIPPHMGISIENAYFSLKWNGKDEALNCTEMIQRIQRKGLPVLAVQLNVNFTMEACYSVFKKYETTIPNEITCLAPIKRILREDKPTKLSELMEVLESNGEIETIVGFNTTSREIELPTYSIADIHAHLQTRSN